MFWHIKYHCNQKHNVTHFLFGRHAILHMTSSRSILWRTFSQSKAAVGLEGKLNRLNKSNGHNLPPEFPEQKPPQKNPAILRKASTRTTPGPPDFGVERLYPDNHSSWLEGRVWGSLGWISVWVTRRFYAKSRQNPLKTEPCWNLGYPKCADPARQSYSETSVAKGGPTLRAECCISKTGTINKKRVTSIHILFKHLTFWNEKVGKAKQPVGYHALMYPMLDRISHWIHNETQMPPPVDGRRLHNVSRVPAQLPTNSLFSRSQTHGQ